MVYVCEDHFLYDDIEQKNSDSEEGIFLDFARGKTLKIVDSDFTGFQNVRGISFFEFQLYTIKLL